MAGPCTWPISYAACTTCLPFTDMPVEDKAGFEAMAAEYLWHWTLRQFGVCRIALRPCRRDCAAVPTFWGGGPYTSGSMSNWVGGPALVGGEWLGLSCGRCAADQCSCGVPSSLQLPGPVKAVYEVKVDGVVLDPSAYRLDTPDYLVRLDGSEGGWPTCQDMSLPLTEAGTWSVTYDRGVEVPIGGQLAAGMLACELAKAACRDNTCQLPQRVQTITRQGVTMALIDSFQDIDKGYTGIWLIDSWIASVTKPQVPSRVYSVDVPRSKGRVSNA